MSRRPGVSALIAAACAAVLTAIMMILFIYPVIVTADELGCYQIGATPTEADIAANEERNAR